MKQHRPAFPWRAVPVTGYPDLVNIVSDEPSIYGNDFTPVADMLPKDGWLAAWLLAAEAREAPPSVCIAPEHPELRAIRVMAAAFEELGSEPCEECGFSLNEIRDYINLAEAAKELVRANDARGLDRPRPDIAWRNLKAAVAALASETGSEECNG